MLARAVSRLEIPQLDEQPDRFVVSCLRCGCERITRRSETDHLESAECPSCGYLGWCEPSAAAAAEAAWRDQQGFLPALLSRF